MILSRWFKLDKGVQKSREGIFARIASVFEQPRAIDDDLWNELEELLLQADVGVHTTDQLLEILRNEVELGTATSSKDLYQLLREELVLSLSEVVFDAVTAARARGVELLIVDTAGRLHTKVNLMDELKKIRRVLERQNVQHVRTLLVLDASTGQNAVVQGRAFKEATGLDGLILAKLDGTAKGGVVFAIVDELEVPVLFVGTGEQLGDLSEFDPDAFVRALFKAG